MGQYIPYDENELLCLDNFFAHFPFGCDPFEQVFPLGLFRTNSQNNWDITTRESLEGSRRFASEETIQGLKEARSEKLLNQTPAQFYTEVDATVKRLGMSLEKVAWRINVYLHDRDQLGFKNRDEARKLHDRLSLYLLPIYKALRESGYNPRDLRG